MDEPNRPFYHLDRHDLARLGASLHNRHRNLRRQLAPFLCATLPLFKAQPVLYLPSEEWRELSRAPGNSYAFLRKTCRFYRPVPNSLRYECVFPFSPAAPSDSLLPEDPTPDDLLEILREHHRLSLEERKMRELFVNETPKTIH